MEDSSWYNFKQFRHVHHPGRYMTEITHKGFFFLVLEKVTWEQHNNATSHFE